MQNSWFQVSNKGGTKPHLVYRDRFYILACTNQRDEDAPCREDGEQLGGVYKKLDIIKAFNIRLEFKLTSIC